MTATTAPARSAGPLVAAELDEILRTHRAQLFGHLASLAAHHGLDADDVFRTLPRRPRAPRLPVSGAAGR